MLTEETKKVILMTLALRRMCEGIYCKVCKYDCINANLQINTNTLYFHAVSNNEHIITSAAVPLKQ